MTFKEYFKEMELLIEGNNFKKFNKKTSYKVRTI